MIAGVDAGSRFIKISLSNSVEKIIREHHGRPEKEFESLISSGALPSGAYYFTGHYGELLASLHHTDFCDEVSAVVESVRGRDLGVRFVVNVGASSIRVVELDGNGDFLSYRENTLCAAGTGSFLDEQMHRMGFDYDSIHEIPVLETPPDVATRCAVFAKSDLIHRQQEGFTRNEMWNGLCRGVVSTMLGTAFKGDIPRERILFAGGFFKNGIVRKWIERSVEKAVFIPDGEFLVSEGALILGKEGRVAAKKGERDRHGKSSGSFSLEIKNSVPWHDNAGKSYSENGNEIRIRRLPAKEEPLYLGIDIGSTSTKCALIDAEGSVIIDIYRKTAGDPLSACSLLFDSLGQLIDKNARIAGCGTTGSGRKLIGAVAGADNIVNEITAHFAGARATDPSIETIFEIGGQDSKYIRGYSGNVADCNMNFVCAAGTGSFIEEQVGRLGFDVREIGDIVLGRKTPQTSDRCTVFMEQDINRLLREGYTREETLSGVIHSVAKNYLSRVVGARPVTGDKIFFQGATARNKGLVAAFERLTGKQIVVSPDCHVMGALGAALIAKKSVKGATKFKGLDVFRDGFKISYENCSQCLNKCTITVVTASGGAVEKWGYKCGKESEQSPAPKHDDHFRKIISLSEAKDRSGAKYSRGTIGIPRSLTMFSYIPLWRTFFRELGFDVRITGMSTKKEKERGVRLAKSDFCFPVKMSIAHAHLLSEDELVDAIFLPTVISEKKQKNGMPRVFCPYVISFPSVIKKSFHMSKPVISPSLDFRFGAKRMVTQLHESLHHYGLSEKDIARAYEAAQASQYGYLKAKYDEGKRILDKIASEKKVGITIVGRPYNLYDRVINLGLTEYFKSIPGVEAFPFEALFDPDKNDSDLNHVYWNFGERILYAAEKIKRTENLYPVYFTNFGCGPDSFILTRFEKIMKGKPYLIIELDEHGSDTGYQTRIEAFIDVIRSRGGQTDSLVAEKEKFYSFWDKKDRKLWIPGMHEISASLFAAGFRAYGYESEALPVENREAFEIGKRVVRGSECLPAVTTIGSFVRMMKERKLDPNKQAYFMATAEGPCRFGQYMVLHKNILEKNGMSEVEIFAPTSTNSYMGMPTSLRTYVWSIVLAGDMIYKYICRRRPYEYEKGSVDKVAAKALSEMERSIEKRKPIIPLMRKVLEEISKVPVKNEKKPLVGIVGEIYVRSNPFCNDQLIRYVEANGGEAWLSPMSEWIVYTAWMERYFSKLYDKGIFGKIFAHLSTKYIFSTLHKFEKAALPYLEGRIEPEVDDLLEIGKKYIPLIFEGETILTIARAVMFRRQGASLVVNCSPFGCMPGNITSSILQRIHEEDGSQFISLFYDGESDMNRMVRVYLNNLRKKEGE
jgi:predicted CoA-substrate-specific enzyme activase